MLSDSAELLPSGARERVVASALRVALTVLLKPVLSPLVPIAAQRWWMHQLARLNRPARGVAVEPATVGGVAGEWLRATSSGNRTILYLHGGGFCTGSAATHRALTSRGLPAPPACRCSPPTTVWRRSIRFRPPRRMRFPPIWHFPRVDP